VNAR